MIDIEIPHINTVKNGIPLLEILEKIFRITSCLAIENRALDPPIMEDKITDVVAKIADIATNSRIQKLFVATVSAASTGAVD